MTVDDSGVMTLVDSREKAMEASDMVAALESVEILVDEMGDASNESMILFYTCQLFLVFTVSASAGY